MPAVLEPPPVAAEATAVVSTATAAAVPSPVEMVRKLNTAYQSSAHWFYWIAGLSALNSVLAAFGAGFVFVIGLGITQALGGIGLALDGPLGPAARFALLPLEFLVAGAFVGAGILALKGHRWAYITGTALYGLDALLCLAAGAWVELAFHGFVLFCLAAGLGAAAQLAKLRAQPAAR
jgi:hypothetical protein